jgi:hypothetical protein
MTLNVMEILGALKKRLSLQEFSDSRHMNLLRLLTLGTDRTLPPGKYSRYSFDRGRIDPRALARPEGSCQ